jgi:hypothetical protein
MPKIHIGTLMHNLLNRRTIGVAREFAIEIGDVCIRFTGYISSHDEARNECSSLYLTLCIDVWNLPQKEERTLDLDAISFFAQALEIWAMTYQFV